ncbi:MAG: uroporphyrinogen-III synthase [Polyangiaceae bacterium]
MLEQSPPVVALLESRMSRELARLVEKHGGLPLCVPALRESAEFTVETAHKLIDDLARGHHEFVVFMTGVAVSLLFEMAEQAGRRPELVKLLRSVTTVCRGPKPTAALRGFGVPPTLSAREPFTSAELIDSMANVELRGRRVLLLHYGERSETLAETLLAQRAELSEIWLYRWLMPIDSSGLSGLVGSLLNGDVDALAITCQAQFRHLYQVAEELKVTRELVQALNQSVAVGAVGPTCAAILEAHGVHVDVMPEHPKMGPLVIALMRHLDNARRSSGSTASMPALVASDSRTRSPYPLRDKR